jgi:hypothetical protein
MQALLELNEVLDLKNNSYSSTTDCLKSVFLMKLKSLKQYLF